MPDKIKVGRNKVAQRPFPAFDLSLAGNARKRAYSGLLPWGI